MSLKLALGALIAGGYLGGWAVITVDDLPEYAVAGQALTLTYTVRQHGMTPISGLQARVAARDGRLRAEAAMTPEKTPGKYTATMTLPQPGNWEITIHSGFGRSNTTLLPIPVIAAGAPAPRPLAAAERGRQLFVAKGCVGCHMNGALTGTDGSRVGPDLTGRRYAADYLGRFLANPAMLASARRDGGEVRMPNLGLKQPEIAALVAFINSPERQASR